jgi:hypothetical protein
MKNQRFWAKALVLIVAVATLALLTRTATLTASLADDIIAETEFHQLLELESQCRNLYWKPQAPLPGNPEF